MKNPIPQKGDDIGLQRNAMMSLFPAFNFQHNKNFHGWIGSLSPTAYSDIYKIKIKYNRGSAPKAYVLLPKLKPGCPHIYPSDGSLCLFYPREQRWQKHWLIAQRFVPWISEYLFFYEFWVETGSWFGDEAPHTGKKKSC